MPPLSVNPHLLPESSVIVSRSDIYTENEDFYVQQNYDIDPKLVNHLKELVSTVWDLSPDLQQERSKKRRKLCSSESTKEGEWIAFRLLSSSKPHHRISLRPKTPPPPVFITREPETEDNELQATIRAERAQTTAVDGSSILSAGYKSTPRYGDSRKLKHTKTTSTMSSLPVMMLVESNQLPRSTRPPVPASHLQQHPYNNGPVSSSKLKVETSNCPVIELAPISPKTLISPKRRRRRKSQRDRPMPAFWRPDPAAGGKCLGYAMGFPCSVEVLQSGNNSFTGYPRDAMRKMLC